MKYVKNKTMKNLLRLSVVFLLVLSACKENANKKKDNVNSEITAKFDSFGAMISNEGALDSKDREVIVNGKAYVTETSVADLKHYAEDAGKTKEEIAKITMPKLEFAFEADGVLMKK